MQKLLVILAFLPLIHLLQAQSVQKISLDQAIEMGMAHSQQLKISGGKLDAATAKMRQAKATLVPNVSLSSNYSRLSTNVTPFVVNFGGKDFALNPLIPNQYLNRISLSYPVFTGFRAVNYLDASEFLQKAAALDVDKDRAEVRFNLAAAYLNVHRLTISQKTLSANFDNMSARLRDVKNYEAAGTALPNDRMKAEYTVNQVETSLKEVENSLAAANFALVTLLGLPENTQIETQEPISSTTGLSLEDCINQANGRPEYAAAINRRSAAEKNVAISRGNYYPTVTIGANVYDNRPNQRVFPPEDKFKSTWDAGVTVSWSLSGLFTNRFVVQETKANLLQSDALVGQLNENAKTEIAAAWYATKTAAEKVGLAQKLVT